MTATATDTRLRRAITGPLLFAFILGDVLLLAEGEAVRIGQPTVDGAQVTARVLSHDRGDKIRVFKRKKRKGFHKTIGHRQALTDIEIVKIGG